MIELTYTQVGDYLYPNITVGDQKKIPLGKYGRMRRAFLEEHQQLTFTQYMLNGKLFEHLREVDRRAEELFDTLMPQLKQQLGVTEDLKMQDQMRWVQLMNSIHAQIEEIILAELVYV